jgi:hypothetical protein
MALALSLSLSLTHANPTDPAVEETLERTLSSLSLSLLLVLACPSVACVSIVSEAAIAVQRTDEILGPLTQGRRCVTRSGTTASEPKPRRERLPVRFLLRLAHATSSYMRAVGLLWDMHNPDDIRRIEASKKAAPSNYYRILSLDGGGALAIQTHTHTHTHAHETLTRALAGLRAILECVILERILECYPDFIERVDLFAGVSGGSMVCCGLACGTHAHYTPM